MGFETAVQAGIYEALNALSLTVYDKAPQVADSGSAAAFPCVETGAIVVGAWDTKTDTGFDFVARIHTYSRSGSLAECKGIQGQIYDRLHLGEISIAGYNLILLQRETSNVINADDDLTHGVCEYRGLAEKA